VVDFDETTGGAQFPEQVAVDEGPDTPTRKEA
jgi:hypothetical protein